MLVFFCNTLKNKRTSLTAEGISWILYIDDQFSSVQFSRSVMSDFVTPWNAALQASLSITSSWNLLKLTSIESVMPSNHLILCRPPSPPTLNLSQHQGLFQCVGSSHQTLIIQRWECQHPFLPRAECWSRQPVACSLHDLPNSMNPRLLPRVTKLNESNMTERKSAGNMWKQREVNIRYPHVITSCVAWQLLPGEAYYKFFLLLKKKSGLKGLITKMQILASRHLEETISILCMLLPQSCLTLRPHGL